MDFSQRTTLTAADWRQCAGRNVAGRDGGIELVQESGTDGNSDRATAGVAYRQFDAGSEAVQWHRLVVDHHEPAAGTQLQVAYVASDEPTPLDEPLASVCGVADSVLEAAGIETVWEFLASEPDDLAEHSDHSPARIREAQDRTLAAAETATEGCWQTADTADDILLAAATGRYLTVRLELVGTRRFSPRVESVRASWPRQSYLRYLPEIYQKQGKNGTLEQFLAVFGTLFTDLEREIETTTALFDPQAVPAEALPWLAEWLGVETPPEWPTPAVRKRLAAAPDHQPTRGTKDGLRNMLALYLAHIEPAEPLDSDRLVPSKNTPGGMDVEMQQVDHGLWILEKPDLDEIGPAALEAYSQPFNDGERVVVYAGPFEQRTHKQAVAEIIDRQTPAHITHRLVELDTAWRLGVDGFLGETSHLAESGFELGGTRLGSTAEIAERNSKLTAELD